MIRFFVAEGGLALKQKREVRAWLNAVLLGADFEGANLNYILCGDEYINQLNTRYLKHNTYTDIITFPCTSNDITLKKQINGECYISTERVAENARNLGVTYWEELHRVMVHGLLHLMGQDDKTREEQAKMRQKENNALRIRKFHVEQPDSGVASALKRTGREKDGGARSGEADNLMFHVEHGLARGGLTNDIG